MKIEDIIKSFNEHLKGQRKDKGINDDSFLVLSKKMEIEGTFKLYKKITMSLWFVPHCKKNKKIIFEFISYKKVPTGEEDKAYDEASKEFCISFFHWINTQEYQQVIEGTYNGI